MKNYRRPEPEVRVKASTISNNTVSDSAAEALPQAANRKTKLIQFPDRQESIKTCGDYIRSSHARPSAWVRFGKIEVKEQNLTPSHAIELAQWLTSMVDLAETLDKEYI